MEQYQLALALLSEASNLMESIGDTLIAAHIATPLAMVEERLHSEDDVATQGRPLEQGRLLDE